MKGRLLVLALVILLPCVARAEEPAIFTSTRYVMDMAFSPEGALWVATRGGVLRRDADGTWHKFTLTDGLPSNEARRIIVHAGSNSVQVEFPKMSAEWFGGKWTARPMVATKDDASRTPESVPASGTGSHISARCSFHGHQIAAMFGDGLYEKINDKWTPFNICLPSAAREITALASRGSELWIGTRSEAIWEYDGKVWTQHLQPNEPCDHDIQCIAEYRGSVFFSTLQEGLVVRSASDWRHVSPPEISSNAPRQMVEFNGSLYVRNGDGKVDRFDGVKWTMNVCKDLPRKEVSAIASDGHRLYAGQWGGWSEFDGRIWTHHLKLSELQGCAVTVILPRETEIWIGTQGRGLAEIDRTNETVHMHDEREGLADDWVKRVACVGETVYAGTFVGGLFTLDKARWVKVPDVLGAEITDLSCDASGNLIIATRSGIWRRTGDAAMHRLEPRATEAQAVCPCKTGTWIGTRTGIWFLP